MVKRFLALLMCLVFLLSFVLVTPAYAASASDYVSGDFFSWVFEAGFHTMAGIVSPFFDDICPSAPGLTTEHSFVKKTTTVDGKTGLYYICEYCGKSAGEVGTEAYDAQVAELPAQGVTSDGALLWSPKFDYMRVSYLGRLSAFSGGLNCPHGPENTDNSFMRYAAVSFDCANKSVAVRPTAGNNDFYCDSFALWFEDVYPIDGYYIGSAEKAEKICKGKEI